MLRETLKPNSIRGKGRLCRVQELPGGELLRFDVRGWNHNDVLYEWATIVGNLLRGSPDGKPWQIGGMYLEFENDGGAEVEPPTVTRADPAAYYAALSSHPTRDYLRVPLSFAQFATTDEANFPNGNLVTFFARSSGVTGVHGKEFSSAEQSRVYGGALVAFPVFADSTQDTFFSRLYFDDPQDQLVKGRGEIMLEWPLTLE